MIENSTLGLTTLDGDRKVVVTGEEHHQNTLWAYAPREGRALLRSRSSSCPPDRSGGWRRGSTGSRWASSTGRM